MTSKNTVQSYGTLEEIRLRKDQLSEAIEADSEQISTLWNGVFRKQEESTKGEYIASLVTNTITAIDAFLLVRKLMKNYSGLFSLFKSKKKRH
jgi:hypothetical protein